MCGWEGLGSGQGSQSFARDPCGTGGVLLGGASGTWGMKYGQMGAARASGGGSAPWSTPAQPGVRGGR